MDASLPILVATDPITDVSTIVVDAGAGLSCQSNDVQAFLHCVEKLHNDQSFRKKAGEASRELLNNQFTVMKSANILLKS